MIKRFFDIFIVITALIILLPVMLLVSFFIKLILGGPILFRQVRPGLNGKLFEMFKFRTMNDKTDMFGNILSDAERLSSFGKFLRSTSLDELPGLYNVLKGDMSLVGPRPLLVEYLPLYSQEQNKRHNIKPGITGWAQVNGRNAISWDQKFKLDIWYVENQSFLLDIKILFLTVLKVLRRSDVSSSEHVTMETFKGNDL